MHIIIDLDIEVSIPNTHSCGEEDFCLCGEFMISFNMVLDDKSTSRGTWSVLVQKKSMIECHNIVEE
jgi:hypothetical protein